jgi:hypothetical protein
MSKYVPMDNQAPSYYSLIGAVNHFGLTSNEIIDMAIIGEIVLSKPIPNNVSPYLMSVFDPEALKAFGFIKHTKKELSNISMLPKEVAASYLNLSVSDCKALKTSNLKKSIFESVFLDDHDSDLRHQILNQCSDFIYEVNIGRFVVNIQQHKRNENPDLKEEINNNFSSENIERLMNGFHAVWSEKYLRKFVLIDDESEINDIWDGEFLASSNLNQSHIKELTISQNDIEISSNYAETLEKHRLTFKQAKEQEIPFEKSDTIQPKQVTIDDIPVDSVYYLPPNCRYSTKLIYLAILGFRLYENESLPTPKNLTVYIQHDLSISKKEAETAAFFINPNPNGKMKEKYKHQAQFRELVKAHQKFYLKGKIKNKSRDTADKHIPNSFDSYGYSADKCRYAVKLITPDN